MEELNSKLQLAFFHKTTLALICEQIAKNDHEIEEEHISLLYKLFGETLLQALKLVDDESVELVTIVNTQRQYILVQDEGHYHTLHLHIAFCRCDQFKSSLDAVNNICKHILASELALASSRYKSVSTPSFVSLHDDAEVGVILDEV